MNPGIAISSPPQNAAPQPLGKAGRRKLKPRAALFMRVLIPRHAGWLHLQFAICGASSVSLQRRGWPSPPWPKPPNMRSAAEKPKEEEKPGEPQSGEPGPHCPVPIFHRQHGSNQLAPVGVFSSVFPPICNTRHSNSVERSSPPHPPWSSPRDPPPHPLAVSTTRPPLPAGIRTLYHSTE